MGLVFIFKGSIYSIHSELYGTKEPASDLRPNQMGVPATSLHPQTVIICIALLQVTINPHFTFIILKRTHLNRIEIQ